jgi:ATP-dependent RNA helicase DOB1
MQASLGEYHALRLKLAELEKKMMVEVLRPERVLIFLQPGRLVKVREGGNEWGWGVVVNVVRKSPAGQRVLPSAVVMGSPASSYSVDTLLHCASGLPQEGQRLRPRPCPPGGRGEMHVVPVPMQMICAISALRVSVPNDLRPPEARRIVLMAVQELDRRFPDGVPKLDPIEVTINP